MQKLTKKIFRGKSTFRRGDANEMENKFTSLQSEWYEIHLYIRPFYHTPRQKSICYKM